MESNYYGLFTYRNPDFPIRISLSLRETLELQRILKLYRVNAFYQELDLLCLFEFYHTQWTTPLDIGDSDRLLNTHPSLQNILNLEVHIPDEMRRPRFS